MADTTPSPTTGKEVCDHVLRIIDSLTPNRDLTVEAIESFIYAPGSVAKMNNKSSFQRIFEESSWEDEKKRIEAAAVLHGQLCHLAAELRDGAGQPQGIDSALLEATGRVVRLVCPAGTPFLRSAAGTWCSWP